ncbi:MAG: hypothetical protein CMK59_06000 [Proteobacteria bacterium]|nr:hypothetical protein [Pseudomonadota bacterium]
MLLAASQAPQDMTVGSVISEYAYATPSEFPPLGADDKGRPLIEYATQGAAIIALPSVCAGVFVMLLGMCGGLLQCIQAPKISLIVRILGELLGALPRLVVLLVVALILPYDWKGLLPLALTWAILSAPSAMDEAGSVAQRLGGSRFVEALKAHGFSAWRIYLYHIVLLNLRPVVVRQGAEQMMQVAFLEISLSYLAKVQDQSSFTHPDNLHSWAELLYQGYVGLVIDIDSLHILALGLVLIALVVIMAFAFARAAEAR